MSSSLSSLSYVMFLTTTAIYYYGMDFYKTTPDGGKKYMKNYFIKPNLTYEILSNSEELIKYSSYDLTCKFSNLVFVIITQFIINFFIIQSNCKGSQKQNLGVAFISTFLPWIFIFCVTIIIIKLNPGLKYPFSDVIGYLWVSKKANHIIPELLINKKVEDKLNSSPEIKPEAKEAMQDAAELIVKICGSVSILMNQIVPNNFIEFWSLIKPLMKEKYKDETSQDTIHMKNEFFKIVLMRDTIGEMLWYIYTGILVCSIVQLQIETKGCSSSVEVMQENTQAYNETEAASQQEQANAESTVYTIT